MLNQPSIAILIDCWDNGDTPPNALLFSNIISFINNPLIKTVVLASYNARPEHINSNAIWYRNYNELFYDKQPLRKIRDLSSVHKFYQTEHPIETTDTRILNYQSSDKFQIAMNWSWELEYYLSLNPEIKNVYVLGAAWESCIKIRPLGYEQLTEINGINVLIDTTCILTMDAKYPNPSKDQNWQHIENNIWKYSA
jgi:hypothetical protein